MLELEIKDIWVSEGRGSGSERMFIERQIKEIAHDDIARAIQTAARYRDKSPLEHAEQKIGAGILTRDNYVFGGFNSNTFRKYPGIYQAVGMAIDRATKQLNTDNSIKCLTVVQDSGLITHLDHISPILNYTDNCLVIFADQKENISTITSLKAIFLASRAEGGG